MKRLLYFVATALTIVSCSLPELHQDVTIQGSKGQLVGIVERPHVKGRKCPAVIIYHGLTGNKGENHLIAVRDSLLANGIAVVRFDFNGHGQSEGKFIDMSLANEIEDAECILEYVEGLDWVDKSRIGIAGHSQGGFVSSVLAGQAGKDRICCAVLMAPAACIHIAAANGNMFGTDLSECPDSVLLWGVCHLGKEYIKSAVEIDPYKISAQYTGPACIIQGTADSRELFECARPYVDWIDDCEYHELEGLSHCYTEDYATPAHIAADFVMRKMGLRQEGVFQGPKFGLEAHRGICKRFPENSDLSYREAAAMPVYRGIETDVQMTSDGVLVCMHDDTIDRTTDGTGAVSDYTYKELCQIHLDGGFGWDDKYAGQLQIPTFEAYLDICKEGGKVPYVELKKLTDEGIEKTVDMLEKKGFHGKYVLTSFNRHYLEYAQTLCDAPLEFMQGTFTQEILDSCVGTGFIIRPSAKKITDEMVEFCRSNDMQMECYGIPVGDAQLLARLKRWGLMGGTCNDWKGLKGE